MGYVVEVPVDVADGSTQVVKIAVTQVDDGLVRAGRQGRVVTQAQRSLGDMLAGVRPMIETFVAEMNAMSRSPAELSIEFGLSVSAEADVIVSTASAQANFTVHLTWRDSDSRNLDQQG